MTKPAVFAVVGWKDSGKTTLVANLVHHFKTMGLKVGTIKHAHDGFLVEPESTDSAKHRKAGADRTVIVSSNRIAEISERTTEAERDLATLIERFSGFDLVICEGFKSSTLPKIEIIGTPPGGPSLSEKDPAVFAVACDDAIVASDRPKVARDDVERLAELVMERLGIAP